MADISKIKLPNNSEYNIKDANVPHSSLAAASGGTDLSLVTTGEKYNWNSSSSDTKVTQTATNSTNADYEVLFSGTADNTTRTEEARKSSKLTFNPFNNGGTLTSNVVETGDIGIRNMDTTLLRAWYTQDIIHLYDGNSNETVTLKGRDGSIQATSLNGVTIGSSPKFTDTTYSAGTGLSLSGTTFSSKIWEGTQAQYDALVTTDPDTEYYITDGVSANVSVINDLSDVSILSPQNGQYLMYNSTSQMWTNVGVSTACSVVAGSSMPSGFPLPNVTRRGNVVQVTFGIQLPAGTYANTDVLWKINPVPISIARVQIAFGGSFPSVNFNTSGEVKFNGSQSVSSATWFIGQAVYLTDGVYVTPTLVSGGTVSSDPSS